MNGRRRWVWPVWAVMSAVGYFLGSYAAFFLGHLVLGNLMLPIGIGAGVGLAQRPVLDRLVGGRPDPLLSLGWPLASALGLLTGFLVGGAAASLLGVTIPFELSWPTGVMVYVASSLVGGLVTGTLQFLLLRPHTSRALWWVLASIIGWAISGTGWAIAARSVGLLPLLLAPTAAGTMLGLSTGGSIRWLFGRTTGQTRQEPDDKPI